MRMEGGKRLFNRTGKRILIIHVLLLLLFSIVTPADVNGNGVMTPGTPMTPGKPMEPGKPMTPGNPATPGKPIDADKLNSNSSLKSDSISGGKDESKPFNFLQRVGHFFDDLIDWNAKTGKSIIDWMVDTGSGARNFLIDLTNQGINTVIDGMNQTSSWIMKGLEWVRYESTDLLSRTIDFVHSDSGKGLMFVNPLSYLLLKQIDSEPIKQWNSRTNNDVNTLISGKEQSFNLLKEATNVSFQFIKEKLANVDNQVKQTFEIGYDSFSRMLKTPVDIIESYFDFNPNARPHGTIKDITVNDQDLMTFADLAYKRNEGQLYESSHNLLLEENIPIGFNEIYSLSRSDITGFSGKAFVNEDNKQVVIAFRGTEPHGGDLRDLWADFALVFGIPNSQMSAGKELTRDVIEAYPGYEIVIVGHSLGGNLAQGVGRHYKIPTATFNGPGMQIHKDALESYPNKLANWLSPANNTNYSPFIDKHNQRDAYNDLILNHISSRDEIGKLGIHIGTTIIYDRDEKTGKLTIYESDDYGLKEIDEDRFWNKISRTIVDGKNGLVNHPIETFEPFLNEGNLRREEDD